jgi:hypothetical protein
LITWGLDAIGQCGEEMTIFGNDGWRWDCGRRGCGSATGRPLTPACQLHQISSIASFLHPDRALGKTVVQISVRTEPIAPGKSDQAFITQRSNTMTTPSTFHQPATIRIETKTWAQIGLVAVVVSIVAVLIVQALAIAVWPEIALFKPLDSYARSALFVLVPAIGATAVLAWLAGRREQPVRDLLVISAIVLLVSIVPDYLLPDANKTLLASTVTAFLHVVAGIITVALLISGYQRQTK